VKGFVGGDIDLRNKVLTPLKYQGLCHSGHAIAAIDCVDMVNILIKKRAPLLSWQHLVDCSYGYGSNRGCDGGILFASMDFIQVKGVYSERAYPIRSNLTGVMEDCRYLPGSSARYRIKSYSFFSEEPEDANCVSRYRVLEKNRPIAVSITGDSFDFFMYS
jgi:hypothetical protein